MFRMNSRFLFFLSLSLSLYVSQLGYTSARTKHVLLGTIIIREFTWNLWHLTQVELYNLSFSLPW